MIRINSTIILTALVCFPLATQGQIRVPAGFEVATLAGSTRADVPRIEAVRNAKYGSGVIAAFMDSTDLRVLRVREASVQVTTTSGFPAGSLVTDLRFDTSREFGNRLYLTVVSPERLGGPLGVSQFYLVAPDGSVERLLVLGSEKDPLNFVMDFTADVDGYRPGVYLFDRDSGGGNSLYHVAGDLTVNLLGRDVLPPGRTDIDPMGMEFDQTGTFGGRLTIADADARDDLCGVLIMRSDLAMDEVGSPVPLSRREYSDMALSPGGDLGRWLFVTDRVEQFVFAVGGDGAHEPFAKGFNGIESLTVSADGNRMYVSDADGVHRIQAEPPVVETFAACSAVSAGVEGNAEGMLVNVGQPVIGRAAGGAVVMHAGVIACIAANIVEAAAGDCNGDRIIDLFDYGCFFDCISGNGGGLGLGCRTYDFDIDVDVDGLDWAVFQTLMVPLGI